MPLTDELGKDTGPIIGRHQRMIQETRGRRGTGEKSRHRGSTIYKISKVGTEGRRPRSEGSIIKR